MSNSASRGKASEWLGRAALALVYVTVCISAQADSDQDFVFFTSVDTFNNEFSDPPPNAADSFFSREYFLESIEHMIDNAIYTSIYSHMSLAPGQRFVSKGGLIAGFDSVAPDRFVAVTDWLIPDVSD
jgi:hypothetical protein